MRPRILLCDEPTGNLDADSARTVADLILELHRAEPSVLVLVTHSAELAERAAPAAAHARATPRAALMRPSTLVLRSLAHYRRSNAAVVAGVAVAVAVLAGALLVGRSVRTSLRALAEAAHRAHGRRTRRHAALRGLARRAPRLRPRQRRARALAARAWRSSPLRPARLAGRGLGCRRALLALPRPGRPAARPARGAAEPRARGGAGRRRGGLDPAPGRGRPGRSREHALRPARRARAGAAAARGGRAAGGGARRVLAPAAAGRGARRVRAARDAAGGVRPRGPRQPGARAGARTSPRSRPASRARRRSPTWGCACARSSRGGRGRSRATTPCSRTPWSRPRARRPRRPALARYASLVYLATELRSGRRLDPLLAGGGRRPGPVAAARARRRQALRDALPARRAHLAPILLNEWTARELGARVGDALALEYYVWLEEGRIETRRAPFRVAGIVPIAGRAADRELVPDYPGITRATRLADWDPPFAVDLSRVKPRDEAYWQRYGTTPKAWVPLAAGQALWGHRLGRTTSLRLEADPRPGAAGTADAGRATPAPRSRARLLDARARGLARSRRRRRPRARARRGARRHRLRPVLRLLQLLPGRGRAAAGGALLPLRRRAAPGRGRPAAGGRLPRSAPAPAVPRRGRGAVRPRGARSAWAAPSPTPG